MEQTYVISKIPNHSGETESEAVVYPLKIFKDGNVFDAVRVLLPIPLLQYCHRGNYTVSINRPVSSVNCQTPCQMEAKLHTPTFLSLKNLK